MSTRNNVWLLTGAGFVSLDSQSDYDMSLTDKNKLVAYAI